MRKTLMDKIPNNLFYGLISLLLIIVGVILTNIYFMTSITMEETMQALNALASVCTLGAFVIAIVSLSSWKKQYAVTKVDAKFEELRRTYYYTARCFYDYFFQQELILDMEFEASRKKPTTELLEEIEKYKLKSEALRLRFNEAAYEYSVTFFMLKPHLTMLDAVELVEIEQVRVPWEQALASVNVKEVNTRFYDQVKAAKKEAHRIIKQFSVEHNELFEKVDSHIRKEFE